MSNPDVQALVAQALGASQQGDAAQAIALLRAAIEMPHADAAPWLLLAAELAAQGQITEAEGVYADTVLRFPELHVARFQLGLLQLTSGRVAIAALTWQPLLVGENDEPLRCYAEAYLALTRDQFQEALDRFRHGLVLPQNNLPLQNDAQTTMRAIEKHLAEQGAVHEVAGLDDSQHVLLRNYATGPLRH